MNVLLIEDDLPFAKAVVAFIKPHGYWVTVANDLAQAKEQLIMGPWDSVLLDRQLPDGDGLTLLPFIRKYAPGAPIVVLTARDKISDRVAGLDAGADDYLVKPFDPQELMARLRAIERRLNGGTSAKVTIGGLEVDLSKLTVSKDGQLLALTAKEWSLLQIMATRKDRIHTREGLMAAVFGTSDEAAANRLDVHVCNLRRKIGAEYLETVKGVGYRLHGSIL